MKRISGLGLVVLSLLLTQCETATDLPRVFQGYILEVPDHFPEPEPYIPADNPLTEEKVVLGKKLFFDVSLSLDSSVSCASCHRPELAFADSRAKSLGVNRGLGTRNAPALINLLYGQSFFWHGSSPTLERQILFPIENPLEMANSFPEIIRRLEGDPVYLGLFQEAFQETPTPNNITDAIAAFERTLISANSPYDRYLAGDSTAMNPSQIRGMELFNGEKAECFHCHGGFNFTFEEFQNNGLYEVYEDPGRWEVSGKEDDIGKFKVPTLRNVAFTAPYMHDGSIPSLTHVLEHYASGGKAHPNKSPLIRRFILSESEKQDLLNFLHALSDPAFIENPSFRP